MAAHLSDLTNTDAVVPLQLLFGGPIVRHSSESVSLELAFVPCTEPPFKGRRQHGSSLAIVALLPRGVGAALLPRV